MLAKQCFSPPHLPHAMPFIATALLLTNALGGTLWARNAISCIWGATSIADDFGATRYCKCESRLVLRSTKIQPALFDVLFFTLMAFFACWDVPAYLRKNRTGCLLGWDKQKKMRSSALEWSGIFSPAGIVGKLPGLLQAGQPAPAGPQSLGYNFWLHPCCGSWIIKPISFNLSFCQLSLRIAMNKQSPAVKNDTQT